MDATEEEEQEGNMLLDFRVCSQRRMAEEGIDV